MASSSSLTAEQLAMVNEDQGPTVIGVAWFFIAVCTIAVVLRFAARLNRRLPIGLDDYLSLGALVLVIVYCVTCIISVPYGMGKHAWATDATKAWKIIRVGLFNALIYFAAHWFIKMSILAFYKRVFTLRITWFKYSVYATGIYTTGWFIASFFAALFQCFPPALFWEQYNISLKSPPSGTCGVKNADLVISSSALNSVGDVVIFALPIAMLWQLQLKKAHKLALILVFATGALAIAAGFIRLHSTLEATQLHADTTWVTADIYMWTAVEAGVGLICSCLPVIEPLFGLAKRTMTSYLAYISNWTSRKTLRNSTDGSAAQGPTEKLGRSAYDSLELDPNAAVRTERFLFESQGKTLTGSTEAFQAPPKSPSPVSIMQTDQHYYEGQGRGMIGSHEAIQARRMTPSPLSDV
ncbi:hypothetical protein F5Y15DRAFT_426036 [Xylariaceae sp. FL0016]|nr:hypothetical protein F5Y15DRAFT_426036 [Xylariaceae sp. FL0016]